MFDQATESHSKLLHTPASQTLGVMLHRLLKHLHGRLEPFEPLVRKLDHLGPPVGGIRPHPHDSFFLELVNQRPDGLFGESGSFGDLCNTVSGQIQVSEHREIGAIDIENASGSKPLQNI